MLNSTEDRRFNLSAKIMVYRQVQLLYLKSLGFGNANANICLFFESPALRDGQCDDGIKVPLGKDRRHGERVRNVGFARLAELPEVLMQSSISPGCRVP